MKILLLDIETAPNKAYVWGLWKQNIAINQIESSGYVLCWAAKWLGEKAIHFASVEKLPREVMLAKAHALLEEADVVVHYNGRSFDVPTLNKEFAKHGMTPPAPYKQIDLMLMVKRAFRFESNRLDYVLKALDLGGKVRHEGFEMWVKCMAGDRAAWATMRKYNKGDVLGLERLYKKLLPWIEEHPAYGAFDGVSCCPKCGGKHYQQRGFAVAKLLKYRRYQCRNCGGWFQGHRAVLSADAKAERMRNIAP